MRTIGSFLGLALVSAALLAGCGGQAHDVTSKELSALTAEISKLRAEQAALGERLETLERGKPKPPDSSSAQEARVDSAAAPAGPRSLDGDRPSLDVVKLSPTAEPPDGGGDDPDADGPRTVLRSGANGIVVEETGPGGTTRSSTDGGKKPAAKKSDKSDRKKTAAVSTP